MKKIEKRILIIAGGTGGHIFPALVVAHSLQAAGVSVDWLGTPGDLEKKIVASEFPLHCVRMKPMRGKGLWQGFSRLSGLVVSVIKTYSLIRHLSPGVVLSMGSYVSFPGVIASWLLRVPVIIHEQNAVAGLSNRCLRGLATRILEAFPNTFKKRNKVSTTGNPVRQEFFDIPSPNDRLLDRRGALRLLVLGGSQGARAINQKIIEVIENYPDLSSISLWHQTGRHDFQLIKKTYDLFQFEKKVMPFIDNMLEAYQWADLVICRAGALTVSELAAVGMPSICVPYPYATDNHQFYNSQFLCDHGAAIRIAEADLKKERLIDLLKDFSSNRTKLLEMANNARRLSNPEAMNKVINACRIYYEK